MTFNEVLDEYIDLRVRVLELTKRQAELWGLLEAFTLKGKVVGPGHITKGDVLEDLDLKPRRKMSEDGRKAIAEGQKRRWVVQGRGTKANPFRTLSEIRKD